MFEFLLDHQKKSRKKNNIIFPNAKYEIENDFISAKGINHIIDHQSGGTNKFSKLSATARLKPYTQNVTNNIPIPDDIEDLSLFSIWSKEKLIYNFFGPFENYIISNDRLNKGIMNMDDLLKEPKMVVAELNYLLQEKKIITAARYLEHCFWFTMKTEIADIQTNIEALIHRLGLSHYCDNQEVNLSLYGLVFKVKKAPVYKPNITNDPLEDAYCCKSKKDFPSWGSTFDLAAETQGAAEAVAPLRYLKDNQLAIEDFIIYDNVGNYKYNRNSLIQSIHKMLGYDFKEEFSIKKKVEAHKNSIIFDNIKV